MLHLLCLVATLISSGPAMGAPADGPLSSIVDIELESDRVTFTDSVGNQWCYQTDPWKLVWRTRGVGSPSMQHGPTDLDHTGTWAMKEDAVVQALQSGIPPWVLSKLTGNAHPTTNALAEFQKKGGVSHAAPNRTSTLRSRPKRTLYSSSLSSFPETRLGVCVGLDPACILGGVHVDFTGETWGLKLGVSGFPVFPFLSSSLRVYGEREYNSATGPYLHVGVSYGVAITYGGGIGWDIGLGRDENVHLQPQLGFLMVTGFSSVNGSPQTWPYPLPGLSISVAGRP
jgi:hypothetical protein